MSAASSPRILAFPGLTAATTPKRPSKASRPERGLEERLAVLQAIAPENAVSVLVITLDSTAGWRAEAAAHAVTRESVRPTDYVSRISAGRIAVVLQAAGEQRAAETAARLSARLRSTPGLRGIAVMVSAATGAGKHGATLIEAAAATLPECG